jgi:hypothetical protein
MGELAPDASGDLGDFPDFGISIEPWSEAGIVVSPVSRTALVSSSTNSGTPSVRAMIVSTMSRRRSSPPRRATMASTPVRPRRVEGQTCDVGMGRQRRLTVGPAGQEDQGPRIRNPIEGVLDHLEHSRVDPVGILHHQQDGLPSSGIDELLDERYCSWPQTTAACVPRTILLSTEVGCDGPPSTGGGTLGCPGSRWRS